MAHGALKTTGTTRANVYCGGRDESACAQFISCIHPTHHFAVGSPWSTFWPLFHGEIAVTPAKVFINSACQAPFPLHPVE